MKYSFVILAFNEELNITICIDAITRLHSLGNSYEIVVFDDGSHDQTAPLIKKYMKHNKHVRLIGDGHNHGRGYGRYSGVSQSSGDYVVMVDADIFLQPEWLDITMGYMDRYDVAGGIAVPDGDVHYIWRRFKLQPKVAMGSTTITGNNGIYKRQVFSTLNFNKSLRNGEDFDFNHHAIAAGYTEICVPGLTVEHQEHKTFSGSAGWLYESGVGATRHLINFHEIRLPDVAFAATLFSMLAAIILSSVGGYYVLFIIPVLSTLGAGFMHIRGKFYLSRNQPLACAGAVLTDATFIGCYYVGRLVGFFAYTASMIAKKPV